MKTKNDSMGVLKLKLEVTPENIECLKSLFLKPENKTSNFIESGTMLFNGKPVEKLVDDLPTVTTLRTKYGSLTNGDLVIAQSNDKNVYIGTVARFTEKTIYIKNVIYVFVNESTNNIGIQCLDTYNFLVQDLCGITKNQ
jgi:hypothetical protein|nr:MAG TPA: hypothetical protein [Caudoviricetes sp.]